MKKEDLIKGILRLRGNILRNFNRIKKYKEQNPNKYSYAQEEYESNVRKIKSTAKGLENLKLRDLESILRELKYIRSLKTSTLKSTKKVNSPESFGSIINKAEEVANRMNMASDDIKSAMFKAYKRAYHESYSVERYKYQIMDYILDYLELTPKTPSTEASESWIENLDLLGVALDALQATEESINTYALDESDSDMIDIREFAKRKGKK